jgi:hypothetical protein
MRKCLNIPRVPDHHLVRAFWCSVLIFVISWWKTLKVVLLPWSNKIFSPCDVFLSTSLLSPIFCYGKISNHHNKRFSLICIQERSQKIYHSILNRVYSSRGCGGDSILLIRMALQRKKIGKKLTKCEINWELRQKRQKRNVTIDSPEGLGSKFPLLRTQKMSFKTFLEILHFFTLIKRVVYILFRMMFFKHSS